MGRLSASLTALALGLVAAVALASCGGGDADLLPGGTASEINSNLDRVQQLVGEGDCIGAEDAAQEVSAQVEALGGVDKQLKRALSEGAERLGEVVDGCEEASEEAAVEPLETVEEATPVESGKPEKQKKAEKEEEKEAEEEEPAEETTPSLPPEANGKGKGPENGNGPPAEVGEGGPSGGVGPGAAVEGE